MAKRAKKRAAAKKTGKRSKKKTPGLGGRFEIDLQRMKKLLALAPSRAARGAGAVAVSSTMPSALRSTVVPRTSVGAAVQAAVSFEHAMRVVAEATDDTRESFGVSWE